ncbi:MAG TPA: hypothetical protein VIY73_19120 [Polyangiaceae bacterium]
MSGDETLWYVKTPDGDVHRVTLDQLDEAFQAGRIDENVMVLAAGSTKWAKLGELAGIDTPVPPPPAMPNSLRPVSMDLSLDLDDDAFKKKPRKGLAIVATLGILAVLGGVLASNRMHLSGGSDVAAAAAAPVTTPPAPPPVTAAAPDPAPPPPAAAPAAPPADSSANKLTDQQKAKLAAADKALEAKAKAHKKSRSWRGGASHSAKYKAQGFTTGGNKFDPLNASM